MRKKILSLLLVFCFLFSLLPAPAMGFIGSGAAGQQAILDELTVLFGDEGAAREALNQLISLGLVDQNGRPRTGLKIEMEGRSLTLDQMKDLLAAEGTDLSRKVTVDGVTLTLGDLKVMLQIEAQLELMQQMLLGNGVALTAQHRASLQSLLAQIETEGISLLAAGAADPLDYTSVNHEIYIKAMVGIAVSGQFIELNNNTVTMNPWRSADETIYVQFQLVDKDGERYQVNDERLKGKEITFQWRSACGSMQRYSQLPDNRPYPAGALLRSFSEPGETVTLSHVHQEVLYLSSMNSGNPLHWLQPNNRWFGDQTAVIQLYNPQNALFYNGSAQAPSKTKDLIIYHENAYNPWETVPHGEEGRGNLIYRANYDHVYNNQQVRAYTLHLDGTSYYDEALADGKMIPHISIIPNSFFSARPEFSYVPGMALCEKMLAYYWADGIAPNGEGYEVVFKMVAYADTKFEGMQKKLLSSTATKTHPQTPVPGTEPFVEVRSVPDQYVGQYDYITYGWIQKGQDDRRLALRPPLDHYYDDGLFYQPWKNTQPLLFNRLLFNFTHTYANVMNIDLAIYHQDTYAPTLAVAGAWDAPEDYPAIFVDGDFEYRSGQYVPITVRFSEPVRADGAAITVNGRALEAAEQAGTLASRLTFLYPVEKVDSSSLIVTAISGVEDIAGNKLTNPNFDPLTLCQGKIKSTFLEDSWRSIYTDKSAYGATDERGTITIELDQTAEFKTAYVNDQTDVPSGDSTSKTFYAHLMGEGAVRVGEPIPLRYMEENNIIYLSGDFALPRPVGGDGVYALEFYRYGADGLADPGDELLYGKYHLIYQEPVILAAEGDLSIPLVNGQDITVKENWPSGAQDVVYMIGETATVLGFSYNGNATFQDPEHFVWSSSDTDVASIDPSTGEVYPGSQPGTVTFTVSATDGGFAPPGHTAASASITLTVSAGGPPAVVVPENSNIVRTYPGKEALVRWSTNVIAFNKGLTPPVNETYFTMELFEGKIDDPAAGGAPVYTWSAPGESSLINATSFTVPGEIFETIHIKPEPSFTAKISTPDPRDPAKTLFAYAYIVVCSEPAEVKLVRPDTLYFADERDEGVVLSWELDKIDPTGSAAELRVDKNGEQVGAVAGLEEMTDEGGQRYSGIRYLDFDNVPGDKVRDIYTVTLKAKNESDGTWSYDSFVLYVYNQDMMQILVDGRAAESLLMSNVAEISGRAAELAALPGAQEVMALREEIRLRQEIGIKQGPAGSNWNTLDDVMAWVSGDSRVASVNYKQGALYENIEGFSYSYYLAATRFALSGKTDGKTTVTATHAKTGMIDELAVTVETLTDQLYLFQFAPMQKTKLTYTDGAGVDKTVYSNDEGALALYEPQGIASEVALESKDGDGALYLGTLYQRNLVSGERDSTALLLYPLNYFKLRRVATVDLFLKNEEGVPYSGDLCLTGGVMKEGRYCQDALINYADGKESQTFTLGADGKLTIEMDSTQFWSEELGDAPGTALSALDDLQFIYELNFPGDSYFPNLVYVDGNLNASDLVRFADSIVTVRKTAAADIEQPFLAVQTIDYGVSASQFKPVLDFTGMVGPGTSYPVATLRSTVLLWGFPTEGFPQYSIELYDEYGFRPAGQSNDLFVYKFSTIPLLRNTLKMDQETIWMEEDEPRRLELRLFDQVGRLIYSRPSAFKVTNMLNSTSIDESEESEALLLTLEGSTSLGAGSEPGLGDQMLAGGLGMLSGLGINSGVFKMIVSPTEDPMAFDAFIWAGKGSSGFAAGEESGVFLEGKTIMDEGKLGVVPSVPDMLNMAKGKYREKQDKKLDKAMDNDDKVTGKMGISATLNGYFQARICYNYEEGKWELLILGGGFTAGIGLEYTWNYNNFVGPVPVTAYIKVGGDIGIDFKAAVRYAELAGHEWAEEITADNVNDYLITLRIAAYIRAFAGVGFDYSVIALKIGIFGQIDVEFQNALLSRTYLAAAEKHLLHGQYLMLRGEVGIEFLAKFLFISYEKVLASVSSGYTWFFNDWVNIQDYWKNTPSGLDALAAGPGLLEVSSRALVESRDYLEENERRWKARSPQRSSYGLMAAAAPLQGLQDNAYPYANPELSDDGVILAYLSDGDSSDISRTEARYAIKCGGVYPDAGSAFPRAAGDYKGYGDSGLQLSGSSDFAAAAWVRQSEALAKGAGEEINADEQALMLNSTEIMASIYDGSGWRTFCLTANGSPDLAPAVAVGGGKVFVAWRNVYAGDSADLTDFTAYDRILYRVYDGSVWSEPETLYNGSSGSVKGLETALAGETAAVAYTLDRSFAGDISTYEMVYATVDLSAGGAPETTKNVQVSSDSYLDENPQLAAVKVEGEDRFLLGWHSWHSASGDEISDIRFCLFDSRGNLDPTFVDALSEVAALSSVNIGGDFRFVKMAPSWNDLESLSLVWSEPAMQGSLEGLGDSDRDLLKAVKFISYGDGFGLSAPLTVAEMPERTLIDHYDAFITNASGRAIAAVILGSEYKLIDPTDPTTCTVFPQAGTRFNESTGQLETVDIYVAKSEAKMYTAVDAYSDSIAVTGVGVDYAAVRRNSPLPVQFTVRNRGVNTLTDLEITLDGVSTAFDGLSIRPNQIAFLTVYHALGDTIKNVRYRVTANSGAVTAEPDEEATLYLEVPDVGISAVSTVREGEGLRSVQVSLYNESDVALAGSDRRVRLGIYSNLDCRDGEDNLVVEVEGQETEPFIIDSEADLALIDAGGYSRQFTFDLAAYLDEHLGTWEEIPGSGVTLYFQAWIEETVEEEPGVPQFVTVPEYFRANNTDSITFDSLLARYGEPATVTTRVSAGPGGATVASVSVRNNSLSRKSSGNLIATLLDAEGNVLKTMQSYTPPAALRKLTAPLMQSLGLFSPASVGLLTMGPEETVEEVFDFGLPGSSVQVVYTDLILQELSSAALARLSFEGIPVGVEDFTENAEGVYGAIRRDFKGTTLVTAVPEHPEAQVYINGQPAPDGVAVVDVDRDMDIIVRVVSADGSAERIYRLRIENYVFLSVEPAGLDFGRVFEGYGSAPAAQSITVANEGHVPVQILDPGDDCFTAGGAQFPLTISPDGEATLNLRPREGLAEGIYDRTILLQTAEGSTADLAVRFTVENAYVPRELSAGGVTISGDIHVDARLNVSKLSLHGEDCAACKAIHKAQENKNNILILGQNISLDPAPGFTGELTVTVEVDPEFNGRTVTVMHCQNGVLQNYKAVAREGRVTFTVQGSLSPFALFVRGGLLPGTSGYLLWFLPAAFLVGAALLLWRRLKELPSL